MKKLLLLSILLLLLPNTGCYLFFSRCIPPQEPIDLYKCEIINIQDQYFVLSFPNQDKYDRCKKALAGWFLCQHIKPIETEPYAFYVLDFLVVINCYKNFKKIPPPVQQLIGILSQQGILQIDHVGCYGYGPEIWKLHKDESTITLKVKYQN